MAAHLSRDAAFDDSAQLYRLIADTIPHMVWTARADGALDYVNARVLEYTGRPAVAHLGWDWKAVIHPEDWERCLAIWTRSLESGERYEIEYRLRRADGVYRWHFGAAAPLRGADGRIGHWFGTCTDIEDRVRSARFLERTVEERTRALRAIIDNEPECVKLLDAQGNLLEMNAAGLRMIEADSIESVRGQCVYGIVAPAHVDAYRELIERVCRGERGTLVFEIVGLKGTRRWLETHAVPFSAEGGAEAGAELRLLSVTRDITEQRRAVEALRESEERFRVFMEHAPVAAWIKDGSLRYTYVNRTYEKVYGRATPRVLGRDDFDLHPADRAQLFREEDERIRRTGAAAQRLHELPYADGRPGHWLVVKFPLEGGVGGIAIDFTPRVEAEEKARRSAEEVRDLVDRLVQTQEAERRRVADGLHDLIGQNLTALGIELQALKQRLQAGGDRVSGPRLDAMSSLVETTIDAIRGVMTDLRPPALEEFGLVPALRWYASQFAQRTGMKVSTDSEGTETRLAPDTELALFRIVQEALTNAAKHSRGSRVRISLAYGSGVRVTIADDGRGFGEHEADRTGGRRGFGLQTMRERAAAAGGRLRIESPDRGTRIVVEIP